MGFLQSFDLKQFNECTIFVETGTGKGDSFEYALRHDKFSKLYSIEIDQGTAEQAIRKFGGDPRVSILNFDSKTALQQILPTLSQSDCVLFFLDAHFPGEVSPDFKGYDAPEPLEIKLPLEEELRLIREWRGACQDVIIIDDLRIYENGPFEEGNVPEPMGSGFIATLFADRQISRDYRKEGYLIITPMKKNDKTDNRNFI